LQFLHWYTTNTLVEILVIAHVILATLLLPINHTKLIDVANCTAINLHYYGHFIVKNIVSFHTFVLGELVCILL